MQSKAKEDLACIIDELQKYRLSHFSTEEDYMQKAGYTEREANRQEHTIFTARVDEFIKRYREGDDGLVAEIMVHPTTWIHEHLCGTDQNYVACLQEHGIP
ncbi:MAG: hemerythrin family protein [Methanospirillaceae archaeon]|nr:hemerythrin family protein [Methanospirillaceae archaeon]